MVEGVVDCSTGRCLPTGEAKIRLVKAPEKRDAEGSVQGSGTRNIKQCNSRGQQNHLSKE